jgi:hypothetical protein
MATNQFLPFATQSGAYVLTPSSYAALPGRLTGYPDGLLEKEDLNSAIRQGCFVAAAVSQFIADLQPTAVNDDGVIANYENVLKKGLRNFIPTDSYLLDTGAANAYVVAFAPVQTALVNGQQVAFLVGHSATGACTLDVGTGTHPLLRSDGSPINGGDLPAGTQATCRYDVPTTSWRLVSVVISQLGSLSGARYVSSNSSVAVGTYVTNSLGGSFNLTLPASPNTGDSITFIDLVNYCQVNNVTILRNGNTIMSVVDDLTIDIGNQQFTLWFNGTTWKLA